MSWVSWVLPLPPSDGANQSRESGRRRKLWATASNCLLLWDVMYQRVLLPLAALSPFRSCRSFGWHRWLLFHCSLSARWPPCCRQQSFLLQPGPLPLLPPPVYYLFSLPFSSSMAERFGPDWSSEETYRQQLSRHSNVCLGFGIAGSFFPRASSLPPP